MPFGRESPSHHLSFLPSYPKVLRFCLIETRRSQSFPCYASVLRSFFCLLLKEALSCLHAYPALRPHFIAVFRICLLYCSTHSGARIFSVTLYDFCYRHDKCSLSSTTRTPYFFPHLNFCHPRLSEMSFSAVPFFHLSILVHLLDALAPPLTLHALSCRFSVFAHPLFSLSPELSSYIIIDYPAKAPPTNSAYATPHALVPGFYVKLFPEWGILACHRLLMLNLPPWFRSSRIPFGVTWPHSS